MFIGMNHYKINLLSKHTLWHVSKNLNKIQIKGLIEKESGASGVTQMSLEVPLLQMKGD